MEDIETCPFCGGEADWWQTLAGTYQVYCYNDNCDIHPHTCCHKTLEEAIAAWNQRAVDGETSDGYHTFNELYHHRAVLFSKVVGFAGDRAWKSKLHADGTMFDGWFIVGVETPEGQATYHYAIDPYWDMFDCKEVEHAPVWDGHTPQEAIARIEHWNQRAERTCEGHRCEETDEWVCHKCGGSLAGCMFDPVRDGFVDVPNFCPSCGEKVVE